MKRHNKHAVSPAWLTPSAIPANKLLSFAKKRITLAFSLFLFLLVSPVCFAQQPTGRSLSFPTSIEWTKQTGVTNYRLQIATDENFNGIYFDGRVTGNRFTASGLPPGYYYWRTAPADVSPRQFSKPVRFFVSGGALLPVNVPEKTIKRSRARSISASNSH